MSEDSSPEVEVEIHQETPDPEPEEHPDHIVVAPTVVMPPALEPAPPPPDHSGEIEGLRHELTELKDQVAALVAMAAAAAAAEADAMADIEEELSEPEDETIPELEELEDAGIFDGPRFWDGLGG